MAERKARLVLTVDDKTRRGFQTASRNLRGVNREFDRMGRMNPFGRMSREIASVGRGLAPIGRMAFRAAAGIAAIAGIGGLGLMASNLRAIAEELDEMAKFSRQIGFPVQSMKELQYIAGQVGVDVSTLNSSLGAMSKRLGEARAGQGALFSYLKKSHPALLKQLQVTDSNEEAFGRLLAALDAIEDPAEKAALAAAAFSRSGMDMVRIADAGAEEIDRMRKRARELGGTVSNDGIVPVETFLDRVSDLGEAWKGIQQQFAITVLPEMTPAVEAMTRLLTEDRAQNVQLMADGFERIAEQLSAAADAAERMQLLKILSLMRGGPLGAAAELLGLRDQAPWSGGEEIVLPPLEVNPETDLPPVEATFGTPPVIPVPTIDVGPVEVDPANEFLGRLQGAIRNSPIRIEDMPSAGVLGDINESDILFGLRDGLSGVSESIEGSARETRKVLDRLTASIPRALTGVLDPVNENDILFGFREGMTGVRDAISTLERSTPKRASDLGSATEQTQQAVKASIEGLGRVVRDSNSQFGGMLRNASFSPGNDSFASYGGGGFGGGVASGADSGAGIADNYRGSPAHGAAGARSMGSPYGSGDYSGDLGEAIVAAAGDLGMSAEDLATMISFETGGTFDPWQKGPTTKWGTHRGLIQWGVPQRKKYGVTKDSTVGEQMQAVVRYLKDRGFKPGMGGLEAYAAINAGHVSRTGARDAAAGGTWGTVADKWNHQMDGHRRKAQKLLEKVERAQALAEHPAPPPRPTEIPPQKGQADLYVKVDAEGGAKTRLKTSGDLFSKVDVDTGRMMRPAAA